MRMLRSSQTHGMFRTYYESFQIVMTQKTIILMYNNRKMPHKTFNLRVKEKKKMKAQI